METFDSLEKAMCKELESINQKLSGGAEMTLQDLDKVDRLTHALKSLKAYTAMKNPEEYCEYPDYQNGMSGHGKYEDKYAEAYQRGFEAGSRAGMSGYYPERYRYNGPRY